MRHILGFYRYNSDVRKRYSDAIEKLPWERIIKNRGASYPSIRDVFLHVLDAYRYWFQYAINGLRVREYKDADPETFTNVDAIRKYEREVDAMVMSLLQNLREEDLSMVYTIYSVDEGDNEVFQRTMESILMHMIEEELQHRGELNCMFWQDDVDPPVTGYTVWLEEREGRGV